MSAFAALRHRAYRLYFSGQLLSMVGTWMQQVAQAWLVHRLTGDARWLGLVAFAAQAPTFLLSLPGGAVADRVRPRTLVMATQALLLLQAGALALLARQAAPPVLGIVALATFMGVVVAFDLPGRQVLVAQIVPKEDLPNAIALNSALFHASRIVGPALAGLLVAFEGEASCFLVNAASYLAALVALFAMAVPAAPPRPPRPILAEMAEGARHVWQDRTLRHLIGLSGLVVMLGMPFTALMPLVADGVLHAGPRGMGWLMGVSGVGATLAALTLARQKDTTGFPRLLVGAVLAFSLCLAAFSQARSLPLAAGILGLTSFFLVLHNTGNTTLVQVLAPDRLRGRVTALTSMAFIGAMPVGALAGGFIAQRIGISATLALGAAGCLIGALVFGLLVRRVTGSERKSA